MPIQSLKHIRVVLRAEPAALNRLNQSSTSGFPGFFPRRPVIRYFIKLNSLIMTQRYYTTLISFLRSHIRCVKNTYEKSFEDFRRELNFSMGDSLATWGPVSQVSALVPSIWAIFDWRRSPASLSISLVRCEWGGTLLVIEQRVLLVELPPDSIAI